MIYFGDYTVMQIKATQAACCKAASGYFCLSDYFDIRVTFDENHDPSETGTCLLEEVKRQTRHLNITLLKLLTLVLCY